MNKRGFNLIEVTVGIAVGAVALGLIYSGYNSFMKSSKSMGDQADSNAELVAIVQQIQQAGRVARSCTKTTSGGNESLACQIDFGRPPTGTLTWIRYIVVPSGGKSYLEYQKDTSGTGNFTSTTTLQKWPNITLLSVCGAAELSGTPSCSIPSAVFNTRVVATGMGAVSRFFRFRLTSQVKLANDQTRDSVYQGAFFLRTPTPPVGSPPSLGAFYRW